MLKKISKAAKKVTKNVVKDVALGAVKGMAGAAKGMAGAAVGAILPTAALPQDISKISAEAMNGDSGEGVGSRLLSGLSDWANGESPGDSLAEGLENAFKGDLGKTVVGRALGFEDDSPPVPMLKPQ